MEKIRLSRPDRFLQPSYIDAVKEYHAEDFLTAKISLQEVESEFDKHLKRIRDWETGIGLPEGFSSQSEFWLHEGVNYIGTLKIRHKLNETLSAVGGHIGYYIRPSERGKGYGNLILKLGLEEAKKLGMSEVLITCDESNISSMKIIENNGGVFHSKVPNGTGEPRLRFWVMLS